MNREESPNIVSLLGKLKAHFGESDAKERIAMLAAKDRNVEGWFKGELLHFFETMIDSGEVTSWHPEVSHSDEPYSPKCDFVVQLKSGQWWAVEVKTAPVGQQIKRTWPRIRKGDTPGGSRIGITQVAPSLAADCVKLLRMGTASLSGYMALLLAYGKEREFWLFDKKDDESRCREKLVEALSKKTTIPWSLESAIGREPVRVDDDTVMYILPFLCENAKDGTQVAQGHSGGRTGPVREVR